MSVLAKHPTTAVVLLGMLLVGFAHGQQVKLSERAPDPHGSPRPARDAHDVPLRTSLYVELRTQPKPGPVDAETVSVSLQATVGDPIPLLSSGQRFARGCSGWLRPKQDLQGTKALAIYLEPGQPLKPSTRYTVRVSARDAEVGSWSFTTEAATLLHRYTFALDLGKAPVEWHGQFFSGLCNVIFCTEAANYGPTYELMAEARKQHPRAWSYQRDFWTTGTEYRPASFLAPLLPNIVRERETRRIAAIEPRANDVVLHLEDVFGHEQYGVPAGRLLRDDYHAGDGVLIADGVNSALTKVISVDDAAHTVTVSPITTPAGGWKIAYEGLLPDRENPDAPGLFAPGGCYLRKQKPVGTPCYYWGRLDKEWDLAHRRYGRRVLVNFADAAGDLARDGRSWTTVKDYAQWHDVARTITDHLIERYGESALTFPWSIFNEPDLGAVFWRADWNELQTFYDYTTDAILRAFEDRGYDSSKVFIGGLELGGIFGTNLKLTEFLAHCSPRAQAKGALPLNAAFADERLAGKRSKRVEALCREHGGKGSPCDFISIHAYNNSQMMAAKLAHAKEVALGIDPAFYHTLWVNSHEACPEWMPPPDEAAADSYLGNGYFPTWCLDVVHRQLLRAADDPRYGFGETILTVWPPPTNFAGINAVTRVIHCDDDGDGRDDRTVTIPMPIFHALGMLSDMHDRYWVLPTQTMGGHVVSGFASRDDRGDVRLLVYSHHAQDTQSRSDTEFDVTLNIDGLGWIGQAHVQEYRTDRAHNSPFGLIHEFRDRPPSSVPDDSARVSAVTRALEGNDASAQYEALDTLRKLSRSARQAALPALLRLVGQAKDLKMRAAAQDVLKSAFAPPAYPSLDIARVQTAVAWRPTRTSTEVTKPDGRFPITLRVGGNGCNFVVIRKAGAGE